MSLRILSSMKHLRKFGHIPVMILLQILFIILFSIFVIYKPDNVSYGAESNKKAKAMMGDYPLFQDVHVMIFIGFGFLMTFLKKYGLSAVSLNMLCAVISLQWSTLVIGFFHLHYHTDIVLEDGTKKTIEYPNGVIYLDLIDSMLLSDFASAAVLISFGVVIGTTSPLQLIIMTIFEIVLFAVNEVIGRKYLGAVDAGDSIFVHLFGAYFGMAVSRVLHSRKLDEENENKGSSQTSDLFSMVGAIFLWMFWPSFNGAAALAGEAQHRAVLNTYFSLCGSVMSAFAVSALLNEHNKFVMEHIQNATLAGGVAIGAVADLFIQPYGALLVGSLAGIISVVGYEIITPWISRRLWIHDTCGVHNLHGMPAIIATILSIFMAAIATEETYGSKGLYEIYPALKESEDHGKISAAIDQNHQAINQLLAAIITFAIAVVGGILTGTIMLLIGKWQDLGGEHKPGSTVIKLALNVGNVFTGSVGMHHALPKDAYFDDNLFFEVEEEKVPIAIQHTGTVARFDYNDQMHRLRHDHIDLDGLSMKTVSTIPV